MFDRLWGFRSRIAVTGRGVFDCPICGAQQPFELRQLARWFTLFLVPIVRTRPLGEHVFCLGCRDTLKRDVLDAGSSSSTALVPALQGLAYTVPSGATMAGRSVAALAAAITVAPARTGEAAPASSRGPINAPAIVDAAAAAHRAVAASAMIASPAPAAAVRAAPPHGETSRRAPQTSRVSDRPAALSSSATPVATHEAEARERPAFGQSAFAKATYARQRRPAPPYGAAVSEPAFFTPRR